MPRASPAQTSGATWWSAAVFLPFAAAAPAAILNETPSFTGLNDRSSRTSRPPSLLRRTRYESCDRSRIAHRMICAQNFPKILDPTIPPDQRPSASEVQATVFPSPRRHEASSGSLSFRASV